MNKKIINTMVGAALGLVLVSPLGAQLAAADDTKPMISLSQTVVGAGEEFEVALSVADNIGIAGMQVKIAYDGEVITPVSEGLSTTLGGESSVNYSENAIEFVWADYQNYTENGDIVTVKFEANADTVYATSDITIEEIAVYNAEEEQVNVATENAKCYVANLAETGTQTSSATDGKYAVRFVGKIDTGLKEYLLASGNSFGFDISLNGEGVTKAETRSFTCNYLMHSISGSSYIDGGLESEEGKEYFALTVYNLPVGYTVAEYSVWFEIDGVKFVNNIGEISLAPAV